jgi:predicted nucleotidyltransferase
MTRPAIDALAQQLAAALGSRLVTLVLYGSAARGVHVPERSDVNTLLLCDAVDEELFARLAAPLAAWMRAGYTPPLILTEREWRSAADAFPIEYEDIREAHRLLAGRDPWAGVSVRRDDVRRQLEHELMGKLVHLRQAYAALRERPKELAEVVLDSAGGFFAMLRAALRLGGAAAPAGHDALVREAGKMFGFDPVGLAGLVTHVSGGSVLRLHAGDALPAAYLNALARTAEFVNSLERTAP